MTRTHHLHVARIVGVFLSLTFCLATPLLAQRADRATISGVVTDAQVPRFLARRSRFAMRPRVSAPST